MKGKERRKKLGHQTLARGNSIAIARDPLPSRVFLFCLSKAKAHGWLL